MTSIRRCSCGGCDDKSAQRRYPRRDSSFVSIFVGSPNPIAVRGTVLRPGDIEVCLKPPPGRDVDVMIGAHLGTFTKVWLGYRGLASAVESGQILLRGSTVAMLTARCLLALPDEPKLKSFRFLGWPSSTAVAAE